MNKVYKDPKIAISTTDFEAPRNFDNSVFNLTGAEIDPAVADSTANIVEEIQM